MIIVQEKKEDIFEKLTGRATVPASTQAQGKVAEVQRQGGDVFQKLTGRATQSALDKKIEVPNAVKDAKDAAVILEQ